MSIILLSPRDLGKLNLNFIDFQLIKNLEITCNQVKNRSHFYKVDPDTKGQVHGNLPDNETRFALLANFYTSNGLQGEVSMWSAIRYTE